MSDTTIRRARGDDLPALGRLGAQLVRAHYARDPKRFMAPYPDAEGGYAWFLGTQLREADAAVFVAERADVVRLDRAATDMKELMDNLVGDEPRQRAVGSVGLMHFLDEDKKEYHLRVLSALLTAARTEDDEEVLRNIRIAIDRAVKVLPETVLQQGTWEGVKLSRADFARRNLRKLDLRKAVIEDADLTGADLSGANLTDARLNGTKLDKGTLVGATLTYTDLAGASLVDANLSGADLYHAKISGADFRGTNLVGAKMNPADLPWDLAKHWREARFDPGVIEPLLARYGTDAAGLKVLMLMWEIAPLVAGGSWTACYHLVRQLRRGGADVTVVVPWDDESVFTAPFGSEVDVMTLGIKPPVDETSANGSTGFSAYGGGYASPYGAASWRGSWSGYSAPFAWSGYGRASPLGYGSYSAPFAWSGYGPASPLGYSGYSSAQQGSSVRESSTMLWLVEEFRRRLRERVATRKFDLIHAHDWVTFPAAQDVSSARGVKWIAHFHSTERDRRPGGGDAAVERIERKNAQSANYVIVPGKTTKSIVMADYGIPEERITVVPNVLSEDLVRSSVRGSFETSRVIFVGRLTPQKGPDRFSEVAGALRQRLPNAQFWAFGAGELAPRLSWPVTLRGQVPWESRAMAFDKASALLVPSRAEPFGMVVLEAMERGVPVLYPKSSGAADVLESGIQIDPANTGEMVTQLARLLQDKSVWSSVAAQQTEEILHYPSVGYSHGVHHIWKKVAAQPAAAVP